MKKETKGNNVRKGLTVPDICRNYEPALFNGNRLNREIVSCLNSIASLDRALEVIEDAKNDALIYNYKGGLTNKTWTEYGYGAIVDLFSILGNIATLAKRQRWNTDSPNITQSGFNDLCKQLSLALRNRIGYKNAAEYINDVFDVHLHYKFFSPLRMKNDKDDHRLRGFYCTARSATVADAFDSLIDHLLMISEDSEEIKEQEKLAEKVKEAKKTREKINLAEISPDNYIIINKDGAMLEMEVEYIDKEAGYLHGEDSYFDIEDIKEIYKVQKTKASTSENTAS